MAVISPPHCVRWEGVEPSRPKTHASEACAAASYATSARTGRLRPFESPRFRKHATVPAQDPQVTQFVVEVVAINVVYLQRRWLAAPLGKAAFLRVTDRIRTGAETLARSRANR